MIIQITNLNYKLNEIAKRNSVINRFPFIMKYLMTKKCTLVSSIIWYWGALRLFMTNTDVIFSHISLYSHIQILSFSQMQHIKYFDTNIGTVG